MRMKPLLLAAGLAVAATGGSALDLKNMSSEERQNFRDEIRAYLLENPEVIMEAVAVLEQRQAEAQTASDANMILSNATAIFDDGFSWVGGNPDGDITLVEFVDYRCGYCRRAHDEVKQLIESDGNIRLIMKEFPILGEASLTSSQYAIAVKQIAGADAYEAAHDALITMRGDPSDVALGRLSKTLGLDYDEIKARMDGPEVALEISATRALAQQLSISGTPTFVVQDEMLRGYLPLEGMREMVAAKRG